MVDLPFTPLGIVRCRDLVQAVRGVRFTTVEKITNLAEPTIITQVVKLDPRRIRYEIYLTETSGAGPMWVDFFNTPNKPAGGQGILIIGVSAGSTIVITRDWLEDGDLVCAPLWCLNDTTLDIGTAVSNISVRETLLSPNPVDEPVV